MPLVTVPSKESEVSTISAGANFGDVATLSNGNYVVVWQGFNRAEDSSVSGVFARMYDSAGTALGNDFLVNTTINEMQGDPDVAALPAGGFVVTWLSWNSGSGIYAQRFAEDGSPVGGEVLINTNTDPSNHKSTPTVTALNDGSYVVAWSSYLQDGSTDGIYAQRIAANGSPLGHEFRVNATTSGSQSFPQSASLEDGGFVITWHSENQDGEGTGIYAQRFAADGTPVGNEFQVNTITAGYQTVPSVAGLEDGGYIVSWESFPLNNVDQRDVYVQRFDANGTRIDGQILVNTTTAGTQGSPSISSLADGGYVVAWVGQSSGGSFGSNFQRFASDGTRIGGETFLSNSGGGLAVSSLENGDFVLARADGYSVFQTLFTTVINNAAPNDIFLTAQTVQENSEPGTVVGSFSANDPDSRDVFSYELLDNAGGRFELNGSNLVVAGELDYELATSHTVTVRVTDSGGYHSYDEVLTIGVSDVSEAVTNGNASGTITGTSGNDVIDAQGGNDVVNSGSGNDRVTGGAGRDIVNAGNGDDTIVATVGDGSLDIYNGGAGVDTLDMANITSSITVNLALSFVSSAQTGLDALTSIENVIGGTASDTITGDGAANRLDGRGGNDTIRAGSGNDVVIGGSGNDIMNGDAGLDVFVFASGFGNDRILQFDANPAGGQDLLDVSAFGITSTTFSSRVAIVDIGADTLVTIDGNLNQTVTLVGIGNALTVTQSDFIL